MRMKLILAAMILVLPLGAQELTLSGSLGMDFLFQFQPPPVDVNAALSLKIDAGKGGVESRTIFSLFGLEAEKLWMWWNFHGLTLKSGLTFDPCFSQWTMEVRGCCPFSWGGMFLLGNLNPPCQTPSFSVGFVLDLGFGGTPGFLARGLIGFGVQDLEHLIDNDPWTEVTLVHGWYFEEVLLHFAFATDCLHLYTTWMFNDAGLGFGELGASYRFCCPAVDLGAALRFKSTFALDWAKLLLGVTVEPVSIYSTTAFDFTGFLWQEIGIKVQFSQVLLYSATRFTLLGLEWVKVGFELRF